MILLASGNSLGVSFPDNRGAPPLVSCTPSFGLAWMSDHGRGGGFLPPEAVPGG